MALNLTNLFTALGRTGRVAYLINTAQAAQGTPFSELAGYAYINPAWLTGLTPAYDSLIRAQSGGMATWAQTAQSVLRNLVTADNPQYGVSLPTALLYLYEQMLAQGASVKRYTVGSTVTPDAANVGSGNLVVCLTRGDGLLFQNVVQEACTLLITADSFTGGATAGREPWSFAGQQNVSSLLTGAAVGTWDWDSPTGSAAAVTGNCVAANAYANPVGNLLTNGDWATWTGGTPAPSYWNLVVGAWGTDVQRNSSPLAGTYCVQFNAGTGVLTELTQQFGPASTASGATAGTQASVAPVSTVVANMFLKAAGVVTGGVMTVKLVDGSGTTINDAQGNPNSQTLTLSTLTTSWVPHAFTFRLPYVLPAAVRLDVKISTALTGSNVYMDWNAAATTGSSLSGQVGAVVNLYPGGPNVVLFSNPAAPFEAAPDPDAYTVAFTNDFGGSTYRASWQSLAAKLFQTPGLILPYSNSPTIADSLITGV